MWSHKMSSVKSNKHFPRRRDIHSRNLWCRHQTPKPKPLESTRRRWDFRKQSVKIHTTSLCTLFTEALFLRWERSPCTLQPRSLHAGHLGRKPPLASVPGGSIHLLDLQQEPPLPPAQGSEDTEVEYCFPGQFPVPSSL